MLEFETQEFTPDYAEDERTTVDEAHEAAENDHSERDPAPADSVLDPVAEVLLLAVHDLREHPAAEHMPPMHPDEWEALRADVAAHGVQEPIRVQRGSTILDGRYRCRAARACRHETIPAIVVDISEEEQRDYVFRSALLRRHLTDDQRAALAALYYRTASAQARSDRARHGGQAGGRGRGRGSNSSVDDVSSELSGGQGTATGRRQSTREQVGARFGVSEHKTKQAIKIAEKSEAALNEVLHGQTTLTRAARQLKGRPSAATPPTPTGQTPGREEGNSRPPTRPEDAAPPAETEDEPEFPPAPELTTGQPSTPAAAESASPSAPVTAPGPAPKWTALSLLGKLWRAATPAVRRQFLENIMEDPEVVALIDELRGRVSGTQEG
jgi:ParB-like nuclease domain